VPLTAKRGEEGFSAPLHRVQGVRESICGEQNPIDR